MSMTQLVIGTALGFFVAQGVLYSVQHLIGWLRRSDTRKRILKPTPTLASTLIGGFTKEAALGGLGGAICTQSGDGRRHGILNGCARIESTWLTGRGCRTCSGAQGRSLYSGSG